MVKVLAEVAKVVIVSVAVPAVTSFLDDVADSKN